MNEQARPIPVMTLTQSVRFWSKVPNRPEGPDECWEWSGALNRGYGRIVLDGEAYLAHRVSYTNAVGSIPLACEIDHTCHNPACVRPSHLEPVTRDINQSRSWTRDGRSSPKLLNTHCPHGHEFTQENTFIRLSQKGTPFRRCKICDRIRDSARYKDGRHCA